MVKTFKINNWPKKILFLFGVVALLSLIFAPWDELRTLNSQPFIMFFQLSYWIALSFFIIQYYNNIDLNNVFKFMSIGMILQIIAFYTLENFKIELGPVKIELAHAAARNALNFQIIALGPLLLYLFKKKSSNIFFFFGIIFLIASALFNNGRAGAIIVSLQCLLYLGNKFFFKPFYIFIGLIFIVIFNLLSMDFNNYATLASYKVEPYNERLAQFMRGKAENTDLEEDRSLLEREVHRNKGKEVFKKFPFLGLGFGNYGNYDANLDFLNDYRFLRMSGKSKEYLNKRSAHNSYVQILSETGGIGFLFFILCFLPASYNLFSNKENNSLSTPLLVSMIGMLTHLFAISAAYGTIFWFLVAIINAHAFYISKRPSLFN